MVRHSLCDLSHHVSDSDSDDSQANSRTQLSQPDYYRDSDTIPEFRALIVDIIEGFKSELDGRFSSSNVGI